MSEVRVIKFNEELFKIPSGTQRKRPDKPIKVKAPRKVSDKTLRNRVLNEIRKNQELQYKSLMDGDGSLSTGGSREPFGSLGTKEFNKDFDQSLEYMNQLAGKVKEKENAHNTTLKLRDYSIQESLVPSVSGSSGPLVISSQSDRGSQSGIGEDSHSPLIPVEFSTEPVYIKPAPAYGCMKVGGNLPTYRAYHTLKNYSALREHSSRESSAQPIKEPSFTAHSMPESNETTVSQTIETPVLAERILSPTEVAQQEKAKQKLAGQAKPKVKRIKKLLRRTYRAGKDKFRPRVGVLLPNKTLRSNVTTKAYMLKQTPIEEVRKTLVKKGFIKHGSSAPNDVLRKIYESIQMIGGEISNYNADNLLYNFFSNEQSDH